jgi:hypothetical protein
MTRDQLMKRLVKKEGKPLVKKSAPIKMMRRDENYVMMERDDSLEYDDFFDFERELSETEFASSRQLAASAPGAESFFEPEEEEVVEEKQASSGPSFMVMEKEETQEPSSSFFVLEEKEEPVEEKSEEFSFEYKDESPEKPIHTNENDNDEDSNKTYKDVVGFQFIQCSYIKDDGERCKRQDPKGHDICSVQRKVLEKKQGK